MFKKILEALNSQYQGVDGRILTRMARKLAKQVKTEEDIEEAVQGVSVMDLIEMESDRKAKEVEKNTAERYEKRQNLSQQSDLTSVSGEEGNNEDEKNEPSATEAPTQGRGTRSNSKATQSALEKQIADLTRTVATLTDRFTTMQQERTAKTRRQQVEELLDGADDKVKNRYMRDFDRLTFKDDNDFNQWLEERTPEITEEVKAFLDNNQSANMASDDTSDNALSRTPNTTPQRINRVTPPIGGRSTQRKGQVSPDVEAYLNAEVAKENATSFSTIAGLPQTQLPPSTILK